MSQVFVLLFSTIILTNSCKSLDSSASKTKSVVLAGENLLVELILKPLHRGNEVSNEPHLRFYLCTQENLSRLNSTNYKKLCERSQKLPDLPYAFAIEKVNEQLSVENLIQSSRSMRTAELQKDAKRLYAYVLQAKKRLNSNSTNISVDYVFANEEVLNILKRRAKVVSSELEKIESFLKGSEYRYTVGKVAPYQDVFNKPAKSLIQNFEPYLIKEPQRYPLNKFLDLNLIKASKELIKLNPLEAEIASIGNLASRINILTKEIAKNQERRSNNRDIEKTVVNEIRSIDKAIENLNEATSDLLKSWLSADKIVTLDRETQPILYSVFSNIVKKAVLETKN